jgi:hypothetical protein
MLRRTFLSALGLGGAGVALGASGHPQTAPTPIYQTSGLVGTQWKDSLGSGPSMIELVNMLRKELSSLDDKEHFISNYLSNMKSDMGYKRAQDIDADIAAIKSFSDVAKIRMHLRRKAEARWEERRNSLAMQIAQILEGGKDD